MIGFFRKIRRRLFTENRFTKYLLYAIGEIILVVIGILIALQINNANEARKNREKERNYLVNLQDDIISDSVFLLESWFANVDRKLDGLEQAKAYVVSGVIQGDTTEFLKRVSYGGKYSTTSFVTNSRTYNELINTGNISLIKDNILRNEIVNYYMNQEFISKYSEALHSGFADYINALKVYDPADPDRIDTSEIPRMLRKMRTDEFHDTINREITRAYSMTNRLRHQLDLGRLLQLQITAYLKGQ